MPWKIQHCGAQRLRGHFFGGRVRRQRRIRPEYRTSASSVESSSSKSVESSRCLCKSNLHPHVPIPRLSAATRRSQQRSDGGSPPWIDRIGPTAERAGGRSVSQPPVRLAPRGAPVACEKDKDISATDEVGWTQIRILFICVHRCSSVAIFFLLFSVCPPQRRLRPPTPPGPFTLQSPSRNEFLRALRVLRGSIYAPSDLRFPSRPRLERRFLQP